MVVVEQDLPSPGTVRGTVHVPCCASEEVTRRWEGAQAGQPVQTGQRDIPEHPAEPGNWASWGQERVITAGMSWAGVHGHLTNGDRDKAEVFEAFFASFFNTHPSIPSGKHGLSHGTLQSP